MNKLNDHIYSSTLFTNPYELQSHQSNTSNTELHFAPSQHGACSHSHDQVRSIRQVYDGNTAAKQPHPSSYPRSCKSQMPEGQHYLHSSSSTVCNAFDVNGTISHTTMQTMKYYNAEDLDGAHKHHSYNLLLPWASHVYVHPSHHNGTHHSLLALQEHITGIGGYIKASHAYGDTNCQVGLLCSNQAPACIATSEDSCTCDIINSRIENGTSPAVITADCTKGNVNMNKLVLS